MPSLVPIDLHTQLTAAAEPPSRSAHESRSAAESSGGFAETLQQRTNADDAAKRAQEPAVVRDDPAPTRPEAPTAKDNLADQPAKPKNDAASTDAEAAPDAVPAPLPQTAVMPDAALPLVIDLPVQAPVAETATPDATELTLPILAPAALTGGPASDPAQRGIVTDGMTNTADLLDGTSTAPIAATRPATDIAKEIPTAKPATTTGADPLAPISGDAITDVVANTPAVAAPATHTPVVAAGDTRSPVASTPAAKATPTDVQADAALPPVTAGDTVAQLALTQSGPANTAAKDTEAPSASAPLAAQPLNTATPATQSAAMHAVASTIGNKDKSAVEDPAAPTTSASKTTGEVPATFAAPVATTPPVTPTRPLSEAVLAQATLAANGNAMEKAVSHQVSKALVQNLPNGDKMMVLRLTPPELGTVKIEVIERQGVLSARLHAEDDGVRLALERFLPSMRQDLRAHDAPIRELTLSDQAQFQRSFADGQQQNQQQDTNRSGNRRQRDDAQRFSLDGIRPEPVAVPRATPLGARVSMSGVDARA